MIGGGRRGASAMILDLAVSLIFFAIFAITIWLYIASNVDGTSFLSEFHTNSISLLAEAAAAGNGDVIVRYDNFKENTPVGFLFLQGEIVAGKPLSLTTDEEFDRVAEDVQGNAIGDPIRKYYGNTLSYPLQAHASNPNSLLIRKIEQTLAITEHPQSLHACPSVARQMIPLQDARIAVLLDETFTATERTRLLSSFKNTIQEKIPQVSEEDANIVISITKQAGSTLAVSSKPTGKDGQEILCELVDQLNILHAQEIPFDVPSITNQQKISLEISITNTNTVTIEEEQIGQSLAAALGAYYR